jgi:hypothetical protein
MSTMKRPLRALAAFALLCVVGSAGLPAAWAEEPARLDSLARDSGARFGDWTVWNIDGADQAYFFIHERTRQVVYLTWQSNGWVYHRDAKGAWHTVYSQGAPVREDRSLGEEKYLARRQPARELARGTYKIMEWTAKVDADKIELSVPDVETRITIKRDSPVFVSNARQVGMAEARRPEVEARGRARLDALAPGAGAKFGDWAVWNIEGMNQACFFIHERTRQVIYLSWQSNGWVYHRDGKGVWRTVYSQGNPEQQDQNGLGEANYLGRKTPAQDLAPGTYKIMEWTAKVGADQIELSVPDVETRITIKRDSPVFVSNARQVGTPEQKRPARGGGPAGGGAPASPSPSSVSGARRK